MKKDINYSQESVPLSARKSLLSLVFVMLGLTFFSASMWAGGTLATGLSFNDFFLAIFVGNFLLGIYTAFLGYIGAKTGLSTHLLTRFSFGIKGSWLPSALLSLTQIGWFGVGLAMFALPVNKATGIDIYILIAVFGLMMTATIAFEGIAALTILSVIAVPSIVVLGCYSVWLAVTDVGGISVLQQLTPTKPISFATALAMVVGSFISAGTLTADFVRFGKKAFSAIIVAMVAFFLGNSLMFIFGGTGAAAQGQSDISNVMFAQGLIVPAIIVLGLNIWTTNNNALYASGLGLANITGLPSKMMSIINGVLGTLCSMWLYNNFVSWLTFLSSAIPPIGGVIIADYIMHRKRYLKFTSTPMQRINMAAILAVACGIIGAQLLPGIVPINSVICSAAGYLILNPIMNKKFIRRFKQQETSYAEQYPTN